MRRLARLAVLLAVLLLCGCGSGADDEGTEKNVDYIIGVEADNPPYYSADASGKPEGNYVSLVEALSEELSFTYAWRETTASEAEAKLADQTIDLFLGTLEPETGETSSLTQSAAVWETAVCLVSGDASVTRIKDLGTADVASGTASAEAAFARYLSAKYGTGAVAFADGAAAREDMLAGFSAAVVMDRETFRTLKEENPAWHKIRKSERFLNRHRFSAGADGTLPEGLDEAISRYLTSS